MRIVRRYRCEVAGGVVRYYIQAEHDGQQIEIGSDTDMDDPTWLQLAEATFEASKPPEATLNVEAEDGTIV